MSGARVTLTLPDGIVDIETVDYGVGPLLLIKFANGYSMTLDALNLTEHDCNAVVWEPGTSPEEQEDGTPEAIVGFGGRRAEVSLKEMR